jgi:hypothetical protein
MAESISQADLDALWGSLSEDDTKGPSTAKAEEPAQASGISQADLDALWGDLGGEPESEAKESGSGGLSQADLNALWGEAGLSLPEPTPAPAAPEPAASSASENLSQDDIDRLLAEMGK